MLSNTPLKILILSPEVFPFTQSGEMGEMVGQLPRALAGLGHDVRVVMPLYRWVPRDALKTALAALPVPLDTVRENATILQGDLVPGVPIYFVENSRLFDREGMYMYSDDAERFIFFSRAVLEMLPRIGWMPDIIHLNGWQTALVPNWIKTVYGSNPEFSRTATVYTIHNLGHQGIFGERALAQAGLMRFGLISHPQVPQDINQSFNFMARGILFADAITTVSENYAREIQTSQFGEKLDPILRMRSTKLFGILNGIDFQLLNPAADLALAHTFDADRLEERIDNKRVLQQQLGLEVNPEIPILALASQLDDTHGVNLVENAIDHILDLGVQFVPMGDGDTHYRQVFADLHQKAPRWVAALSTFDETRLRRVVAGSDILLAPSRFEPDGTIHLVAMHYGCVPVAFATGGLIDSVRDLDPKRGEGTGFLFRKHERWALYAAVVRALECYRRPEEWRGLLRRGMTRNFSWEASAAKYEQVYRYALGLKLAVVEREENLAREIERTSQIMATLPERISALRDLAYNLWWSWNEDAVELWKRIDPAIWESSNHNPVKLLRSISGERLTAIARDANFLSHFDRVLAAFEAYIHPSGTWFDSTYPYAGDRSIAYFSAEFGLHESLPIYSGGLGVLAGDHTKECSDLGVPLIGVGFLYPQGYFRQQIDAEGNQIAIYDKLNFAEVPAVAARDNNGQEVMIHVELPGRTVHAKVWQIQVGRVPLYLMDTDVEANAEHDRELAARLYGGDHEIRIMQEIMLGIGGVRALSALGQYPSAFHINEGHSTFLLLELIRELVAKGRTFEEARREVSARSIFTVHTPVAAGNDAFSPELMDKYFGSYYHQLGLSRDEFMNFARQDGLFSMTVLGLRGSDQRNGVSKLHGEISRGMWQFVFPQRTRENVPITYVTNGVHTATWLAAEIDALFRKCLGPDWNESLDSPELWEGLTDVGTEWWGIHSRLKVKLIDYVRRKAIERLQRIRAQEHEITAAKAMLDPNALTVGFGRRFATYKRATLLFRDVERLKRILNQPERPVQIIFSGKAHPADEPGKDLIRAVIYHSKQPGLAGKISFVEDYDIGTARMLVRGVDIWLNNPRRPLEASGTSGQKAGLNGALNVSILDGWWVEGYNGANGWSIGDPNRKFDSPEASDAADADSLYRLFENEIIPAYFDRDPDGLPRSWLSKAEQAIRSIAPSFSARRMVKEYVIRYLEAMAPEPQTELTPIE